MFNAIIDHIKYSFNGGTIRPAITVFRKRELGKGDLRIWNPLIAHFAGYKLPNDVKQNIGPYEEDAVEEIGDQGNLEFTKVRYIPTDNIVELNKLSFKLIYIPLVDMM